MKELSIEQKAKAYDEAINKLKGFMAQGVDPLITRNDVQDFFPELKESEDNKIRKVLTDYFKDYKSQEEFGIRTFFGVPTDNILTWLEKQGEKILTNSAKTCKDEQKPANDGKTIDFYQTVRDLMNGITRGETYSPESIADELLSIAKKSIKQGEQKPAWSEEDRRIFSNINLYIRKAGDYPHFDKENIKEAIKWLKSLKERVGNFDEGYKVGFSAAKYNLWKPTDEQMKAIEHICDGNYNVDLDILDSIYRDFKKLREE